RLDAEAIFIGIEEDMAQLNDFCRLCIEATSSHLAEMQRRLRHPEVGDVSDDFDHALEEFYIPRWQETERFMVRAMSLLLLSAFSEKCLKELADYLAPAEVRRFKRKGGEAEISALLNYLKKTCGLKFEEPEASRFVREKCRHIRNDFAHGRWDNVKAAI